VSRFLQARDWSVAVLGSGAVALVFVLLLELPVHVVHRDRDLPSPPLGPPLRVSWTGSEPEVSVVQSAKLLDPSPLFMPTPLSVSNKRLMDRGLADKFPVLTSADSLKFSAADLKLADLPPPILVPADPAAGLAAYPPGNLAMGLGRTDQEPVPLPKRQAWVEITAAGSGKTVLRAELAPGAVPGLPGSNWEPVCFAANVNASGLVGSVILMPAPPADGGFSALGADTVEELAKYLERTLGLGLRLKPGFYRISVGP
jgi:hypothetical protein